MLFRYAASRVGREAAQDVVAESFAIAFDRRASFDPTRDSALPWLFGIATNVLRSQRRAERRYLATGAGLPDRGALDIGYEEAIARADAQAARGPVLLAIRRLSRGEREAFLIHALAGLDGAELAQALGVSRSAAGVRLHRARRKLAAQLEPALRPKQED